ncbi:acyltransferase family protein [Leifsonia sp. NPDC102414]|uniref:acyltransferase family protein n=1 Tax=Leifsonia sp. NPDC102414 TaxID=3364124 RepID=UPI0037F544AB
MTTTPARPRRGDIQGLRAVAVALVVVYHAFPGVVRGGFVGVDVFFVISGFLITGLLLRELDGTGRIRLGHFYARRMRRLLPAALTVTLVTLIAAAMVYGPLRFVQVLRDAAWATLSLANVNFGMDPDGYFTTTAPSPFLHFWSLSVEEQYYLLWPVLLIGASLIWKRRGALGLLVVVLVGSLVTSVLLTSSGSPMAYYSLATRAWELAIGGALAWFTRPRPALTVGGAERDGRLTHMPQWFRTTLLLVGGAAILASALRFSVVTPFPGWAALVPTVGAALVIASGTGGRAPLPWFLGNPISRYVGDISYSLYLWHWPVLVIGMMVFGDAVAVRLGLVALAFLLAAGSYRFIEQGYGRIRRAARARTVVATGLAAALVFSAGAAGIAAAIPLDSGKAAPVAPETASFDSGPGFLPKGVPSNAKPSIEGLEDDLAPVFTNGCYAATLQVCSGGDPGGVKTVVLAGDSHAGMWWPAFDAAAKQKGWRLYIVGKNGCPIVDVRVSVGATADAWPECDRWQAEAVDAVASLHPDLIVVDNYAAGYRAKVSLRDNFAEQWEPAAVSTLAELGKAAPVMVFGPEPVLPSAPGDCLPEHVFDVSACAMPREKAVSADLQELSSRIAAEAGATLIDPTTLLCTATVCPVISYNLIMYRDANHFTATFSEHLAPAVADLLD